MKNYVCSVCKIVDGDKITYETSLFKKNFEGRTIDSLTIDNEADIDELIEHLKRAKEIIAFNKERES